MAASKAAFWPQAQLDRYSKWVHVNLLYSQGQLDKVGAAICIALPCCSEFAFYVIQSC